MITKQLSLTRKQITSFDHFLTAGTDKALSVMDNMFCLDIESSNTCVELAPATENRSLRNLGDGPIYTVKSKLSGEIEGDIAILLRSVDYIQLSKVMRPVLQQLFWTGMDQDLTLAEPGLENTEIESGNEEPGSEFQQQMMDTLSEMANVFIGLYTKAIYRICGLNAHHSVPVASFDYDQVIARQIFGSSSAAKRHHLVIHNEFFLKEHSLMLWCLVSPDKKSFKTMLDSIEPHQDKTRQAHSNSGE